MPNVTQEGRWFIFDVIDGIKYQWGGAKPDFFEREQGQEGTGLPHGTGMQFTGVSREDY